MEIRCLVPDDAAEWQRLRLEALDRDPQAFSASLEEYQALSVEEVKKRLWSNPEAFVVGAFQGSVLVGVAGFYRDKGLKSHHKGHIWGVYVTSAQRGKALGRKIMEEVVRRALAIEGLEQLLLSVAVTQLAAAHLYRSIGFEPWGREPRALKVNGEFIDEEYMILPLNSRR